MRKISVLAVFLGFFLAFTLPYSVNAQPYLSHKTDDIGIYRACSEFELNNFKELPKIDDKMVSIKQKTEIIGGIKTGEWFFKYNEPFMEKTIDKIKITPNVTCFKNLTCYTENITEYTFKDVQRIRTLWLSYADFISKAKSISTIKDQQIQLVKYCANIEREWTEKGFEISVDIIPEFAGVSYPVYAWWNSSWSYYKTITIENINPSKILYANYTINISLDTSDLGKFQADCDDVRIVYKDAIELDRNITKCTTMFSQVWFALQDNISASSNDTDYKVYYGNPATTAGPKDRNNVWNVVPWLYGNQTMLYFMEDNYTRNLTDSGFWDNNASQWTYFYPNEGYKESLEVGCLFGQCRNFIDAPANYEYAVNNDGSNPELDTGTGDFSVAFWIKNEMNYYDLRLLVDWRFYPGELGGTIYYQADETLYGEINGPGAGSFGCDATTVMSLDKWYHAVMVANQSACYIYIDGVMDGGAIGIAQGDLFTPASGIFIGDRADSTNADFVGVLDNFMWFDRALTQNEIIRMYHNPNNPQTYLSSEGSSGPAPYLDTQLIAPMDGFNSSSGDIGFQFNFSSSCATATCQLFVNSTGYGINWSADNATTTTIMNNATFGIGLYDWFVICNCTALSDASDNWTLNVTGYTVIPVILAPNFSVSAKFCYNEHYLYVAEPCTGNCSIFQYLIYCQNGCSNSTIIGLGEAGCIESDLLLLFLAFLVIIAFLISIRWLQ